MKDWNEMKTQWQQAPAAQTFPLKRPAHVSRLWATVRRRDWLESIVGVALAPFFAVVALRMGQAGNWSGTAFATLLVGAVLYIPWRLWRARRLVPAPDPRRPVREFLTLELAALRHQEQMLRRVSLWYTAPIAIGCVGIFGSVRGPGLALAGYALVVAAIAVFIHVLNRRAANAKFGPEAKTIEAQLRELEKEE